MGGWTGSGNSNSNSNSNGNDNSNGNHNSNDNSNSLNTKTTDYTKTTRISPSGGEAGAADGIAFDQKSAWGVSRRPVAHAAQIRVVTV